MNAHTKSSSGSPRMWIALFTPKLITALSEGYDFIKFRADMIAGLTVAIVALPLAMAIAIASGTTPERGLFTAIVAGFLISALGGSRFQIGGPTAAFIVVVGDVITRHGYEGLVLASFMAGIILIVVGFMRLGNYIKYIPYPVVTGFTAGIAITIFASQLKEALGIKTALPGSFLPKITALIAHRDQVTGAAVLVTALSLALILILRRFRPQWPGFLIAVVCAGMGVFIFELDAATIGSSFPAIPHFLPAPTFPSFDLELLRAVIPDALTIALLAGIESLLSAVVADGMTGRRHRSNCELVAQGAANIGSVMFGGISATGAIARTATNIRAGARTPVAGMAHALFLALFMAVGSPILAYVPLAALSAILLIVAWNIAEIRHIKQILKSGSRGDQFVLIGTLSLTVLVDLTVGIVFGVVTAALLFMHRMAEAVEISGHEPLLVSDIPDEPRSKDHSGENKVLIPDKLVVYRINGPFFFGAAERISSVLERIGEKPKIFILDLTGVPFIDATATSSLKTFFERARKSGSALILCGEKPQVRQELIKSGLEGAGISRAPSLEAALENLSS